MSKPKLNEIEKVINQIWEDQPDGETSPEEYAKWLRRKLRALVRKADRLGLDYGEWGSDHSEHADKFKALFGVRP